MQIFSTRGGVVGLLEGEGESSRQIVFTHVERSAGKLSWFPSYPLDIDRTTYIDLLL